MGTGTGSHRFRRASRLKHRRLIRALFDRKREDVGTLAQGSIRVVYRVVDPAELAADAPVQVGFSPGRFAKATERNRVKRILREVYREHQQVLIDLFSCSGRSLTLMLLYRGSFPDAGVKVRADLPVVLSRLAARLKQS